MKKQKTKYSLCSEPNIRGILTANFAIAVNLGMLSSMLFGSLMAWRNVAILFLSVPIFTIIIIFFVSLFGRLHRKNVIFNSECMQNI